MDAIQGYVERITFQSKESGFTVARLNVAQRKEPVVIVGNMGTLQAGETISCRGDWKKNPQHGWQFTVEEYHIQAPASLEGIRRYLASGLVYGIGPKYADRIVDIFGTETLNIIDQHPERLQEVKGIGKKRIDTIATCWQDQKIIRHVMVYLQNYGVSPNLAQKIFKVYGQESIDVLQKNPYQIAMDIPGIGFKTADTLADKIGIPKDSTARVQAGILYLLQEHTGEGHTCARYQDFVKSSAQDLHVEENLIEVCVTELETSKRVVRETLYLHGEQSLYLFLSSCYYSERGAAQEIRRIVSHPSNLRQIDVSKALGWVQEKLSIELATQQEEALSHALQDKIHIITGGPGTGKSTITKALIRIAEHLTSHILLAAPTGRAAKRLAEITGREAKTIHSLLEFDFQKMGFRRDKENPLECDLIIIDEASMIDAFLIYQLLKAVPSTSRVVLIGDVDQLPSVGPGTVLRDCIRSHTLSVTCLTKIFRQAEGSQIIVNAHKINRGDFPNLKSAKESDFFFLEAEDKEDVLKHIVGLVSRRLPKKYGFHPVHDIQVLAPMRKGVIGTENLNRVLQEVLNPNGKGIQYFGKALAVGDKVMQIRNNYKKEVFNGDVGQITHINPVDQELCVRFDDKDVEYHFTDLDELMLAYAVSVHKYQGSECPCVVIPIHTAHFKLLYRNLLYTAVTRGKKMVVVVGSKKAIYIAIKNDEPLQRYTGFLAALQDLVLV